MWVISPVIGVGILVGLLASGCKPTHAAAEAVGATLVLLMVSAPPVDWLPLEVRVLVGAIGGSLVSMGSEREARRRSEVTRRTGANIERAPDIAS